MKALHRVLMSELVGKYMREVHILADLHVLH